MADLKTTYQDDVLDTSVNEKRKYNMIQNADGTVSFEDVTTYSQIGDSFGAADINSTNEKVNEVNNNLESMKTYSKYSTYSTEEQVIGKWVDGKTIYRKFVYSGQNAENSIDISGLNIETIINIDGFGRLMNSSSIIPIQFYDSTTFCGFYYDSATKTLRAKATNVLVNAYIWVEYTKVSD